MDKLEKIFEMQDALNADIAEKRKLDKSDKNVWAQRILLAMFSETNEVLDELNFKWWKNEKELNYDNIKEELVDILHFYISLCLNFDMTADELFDIYCTKNKENFDRQVGKGKKDGYTAK